jgi:AcrR family transcriptional regulator
MTTTHLRADAERNRVRIVAAATEIIARDGVDATVESIAQAAGVGMGTLYRRFPTKGELVEAVLGELNEGTLADIARTAAEPDPWLALEHTLRGLGRRFAESRGLLDQIERGGLASSRLLEMRGRLLDALEPVLARAQAAGVARVDVAVTDLLPLTALVTKMPARMRKLDPGLWERYLGVVLDGLRAEGASALSRSPLPRVIREP